MHIEMDRYERYYLYAVAVVLGVFFAALLASTLIFGIRLPDNAGRINPNEIANSEFARPGLRDMGSGKFEARILAQMWQFQTGSAETDENGVAVLRIPQGAEVEFVITSRDVTHGFVIEDYNANIELVPGLIARKIVLFDRPGTFMAQCHEYCGRAHQTMHFKIIVEPPAQPA